MEANLQQEYWDNLYKECIIPYIASKKDSTRILIDKFFSDTTLPKSCLEIGCYPGRYLAVFGEKGYALNGIDLTPNVLFLPEWLKKQGYIVEKIERNDFFQYSEERKFEVVCSFGFIEHFTDWEDVLEKHMNLLDKNGILLVTTPNFSGRFQKKTHQWLDYDNYCRHNIDSMNPQRWKSIIEKADLEVVFYGAFGGFNFWVEPQKRNVIQKASILLLKVLSKIFQNIAPNSISYSPFLGIIAKKN